MEFSTAGKVLVALTGILSLATGQSTSSTPAACTFKLVNNKTFVDNVVQYFDHESYTVILEYYLNFTNVGTDFDLVKRASPDAFQPWRWFRTQGLASSQLLLIYHYYYGFLKPLMAIGISEIRVDLAVSPKDCFDKVKREDLEPLMRDYLLQDFHIDSKTAKHSFKYSDDVEICTARIANNGGWGRLLYRCCGYDSDNLLYCHDVFEDGWVWALRVFIVVLTIFLCLYMPVLIPRGYKVERYSYYPEDDLKFNVVLTKNPEKYRQNESAATMQSRYLDTLNNFKREVIKFDKDVIYTVYVDKLDLLISEEKIFVENGSTIKTLRGLFNAFIRCKIARFKPVKECCDTPACGTYCCHKCPRWRAWVRAIRTIVVLSFLALPSLPFMYAMCANNLDYQNLAQNFRERGLKSTFDFYTGPIAGKVIVGFVSVMYILHGIIVIIDGASTGNINKLYTEVLNEDRKKERVRRRMQLVKKIIKKACLPVKKCGIIFIPCWILLVILSPLQLFVTFFISSPMVQVIVQVAKRIILRARMLKADPKSAMRLYNSCEILLFFITAMFVVIVLTFGANFLVHVLVMTIVMIVVEAELMYRILPVVFILIVYIRDSYSSIGKKFDAFLSTIFNYISNKQLEEMRRECFKSSTVQENKIFQMPPDTEFESINRVDTAGELIALKMPSEEFDDSCTKFMDLKDEQIRFRMKQFLVLLDKDDNMYISKKFMFHCSTVDCPGAPGTIGENYIHATMEFLKIGVFILFIFLVIMAYGTIYYISPTNHLFITLITGLIPLIIKNIFTGGTSVQTVNASNFRFQAQFKEKIESFNQCWTVDDIVLKSHSEYDNIDQANETSFDLLVVNINDDFNKTFSVEDKAKSEEHQTRASPEEHLLLTATSSTVNENETSFNVPNTEKKARIKTFLADVSITQPKF
ncbi:hypothetical protein Btru_043586 [Bulinus truncatus]|nr:hypothetical protein Btru_043586 [Bulinus truncatus]